MSAITLYRGDTLAGVRTWANLTPDARRRDCLRALRDRDTTTLQDLAIAHLKLKGAKGSRISPQTDRSYRTGIKILVRVSERHGLSLAQPGDEFAALFMRALEAEGLKSATIRLRVVAVKQLYRAARWCGLAIPCPWETSRMPYLEDAEIRHPYPEADVRRLLEIPDVRVRAVVLLGAHAGLRAAEICALESQDVDLTRSQLVVRHGKGNKGRVVPLTDELAEALRALPVKSAGEALLWRSYQKMRDRMQEICTLARVEWRGLHALRHTAGTELYRATGDLYVTAQLLGHKDIKTTQVYVQMSQQHLRDALKKRAG